MNPLLLVAIVGVAATALGLGSLSNTITLDVQDLGVGETTLASPVTDMDVAFEIDRYSAKIAGVTETHNVISKCYLHTSDSGPIEAGSTVYCKLTDEAGNVAAEGVTVLGDAVPGSQTFTVDIATADFPNNKVQNIHDLIVVVQGP